MPEDFRSDARRQRVMAVHGAGADGRMPTGFAAIGNHLGVNEGPDAI
jgi:hypothetical protein